MGAITEGFSAVHDSQYHFYRMRDNGLLDLINEMLVAVTQLAEGRKMEPAAAIIDSQSVKTTEAGGPLGYDAGKKIKGRKRHIITDMSSNKLAGSVHNGDIQDHVSATDLIKRSCHSYPSVTKLFADGGYAGTKLAMALAIGILNRCHRLAKD